MKNLLYLLLLLISCSCVSTTQYTATSNAHININARKSQYGYNNIIGYIKPNEEFIIYGTKSGRILKVKHGNRTGYIFTRSKSEYYFKPTNAEIAHQKLIAPTTSEYINNSTGTTSSYIDKTIHTGPRGGKYYINKNGNKTYIPRNKH